MIQVKALDAYSVKDRKAFLGSSRGIYESDPHWVPVPFFAEDSQINPKKNPFFKSATIKLFVVVDDSNAQEILGRVAVINDDKHNEVYPKDNAAFFGFLEAKTEEVFIKLLKTAEQCALEQGRTSIRGPYNPSMDVPGYQTDAFDTDPIFLLNHSPPHYIKYMEKAGYSKLRDLYQWRLNWQHFDGHDRLWAISNRIERKLKGRLRFERITQKTPGETLYAFRELYNDTWRNNWGFVPKDQEEFNYMIDEARMTIIPAMSHLAFIDDKPAAFCVMIADMNRTFKSMDGKLFPFGWIKLLYEVFREKRIHGRLVFMGVAEEHRNKGLEVGLFCEAVRPVFPEGGEITMAWVLEDNKNMNRSIEATGATHDKNYRVYGKELTQKKGE